MKTNHTKHIEQSGDLGMDDGEWLMFNVEWLIEGFE